MMTGQSFVHIYYNLKIKKKDVEEKPAYTDIYLVQVEYIFISIYSQ